MKDYTFSTRKIFETIIYSKSSFPKEIIALVLFGSKSKKVLGNYLNGLSTYGSLLTEPISYQEVLSLIDYLVQEGFIFKNRLNQYNFLSLSYKGAVFMIDSCQVLPEFDINQTLVEESFLSIKLKNLRKKLATEKEVSPFLIFDNSVLDEIEASAPQSKEEFLKIKGLGERKWAQFGEELVEFFSKEF